MWHASENTRTGSSGYMILTQAVHTHDQRVVLVTASVKVTVGVRSRGAQASACQHSPWR